MFQIHRKLWGALLIALITALLVLPSPRTASAQGVVYEGGLRFTAYTASHVATVGQAVFINAVYSNIGKATLTNISVNCAELGRALGFEFSTTGRTTLPPGQSSFIQYRLTAIRTGGGTTSCAISATNAVTGEQIHLLAPLVWISVV
ncbi:MAG: hypothetical protein U0670_06795 [Anaerolineae bacterium]